MVNAEGFGYLKGSNKMVLLFDKFISLEEPTNVPDTIGNEKIIVGNAFTFVSDKLDEEGNHKQFWFMPKLTFRRKNNSSMNEEFKIDGGTTTAPYYIEEVVTIFFGHFGEVVLLDHSIKGFKFTEKDKMDNYFNDIGSTSGFSVTVDADVTISAITATLEALKINISNNFGDENETDEDVLRYKHTLEEDVEYLESFRDLLINLKNGKEPEIKKEEMIEVDPVEEEKEAEKKEESKVQKQVFEIDFDDDF